MNLKRYRLQASVWLGLLLLLAALQMVGKVTALFSDSDSLATDALGTATLDVRIDSPANLNLTLTDLVPGDSIQRTISLTNAGNVAFTLALQTDSVAPQTLLWTDAANGLQLKIDSGSAVPIATYTALNNLPLGTVAAGGTRSVDVTILFPSSADNTFQHLSQAVTFTFQAQQLTGGPR
ncbi:hypothetical protein B5M42_014330 [Paenibacillus athensensis]|uniref:Uncharacterized protein n=1 Tax=Paenibacillus athensensis TaxID=1967502 RepID=A0A4Y8Q981_9BACL|nr:TasA family protein [Paenibacillus athensensis]MCD1259991.1 hypothetical protein [Paenibacillus athensensis]